jgi:acyl carrier protein
MTTTEEQSQADRGSIFTMVRDHLAAELEVSPDRITDETRFRDDLDADSLDLYELVMELEDTYGVAMSEDEAAKIETVGAAVDFVFERLPGA